MGTVARNLLEHINHLKEDRAKTTADLIVQAARGLAHGPSGWVRRYEPVDVIVLESLSRCLFRSDRPRIENRRLSQWVHRRLAELVTEQATRFGIPVLSDEAAYTSRFPAGWVPEGAGGLTGGGTCWQDEDRPCTARPGTGGSPAGSLERDPTPPEPLRARRRLLDKPREPQAPRDRPGVSRRIQTAAKRGRHRTSAGMPGCVPPSRAGAPSFHVSSFTLATCKTP